MAALRLVFGDEQASLRLVYDPDETEQALARGFGFALSYLDRTLAPLVRDIVLRAATSFNGQSGPQADFREVVEVLRTLFPSDAALTLRCVVPAGQSLPRWPGTLRTGPAPALEHCLWPFDPELAAMRAGCRRLAKRDWLTPQQRDEDAAWLSQHDVIVRSVETADSPDRFALFAAHDADTLAKALSAEAALGASDAERESAAAWLGEALGYPVCCVDMFQRFGRRDDLTLAIELLPALGSTPASPLSQWLNGPLALISHTPCSLDCDATLALAKAILAELDRERPGFRQRWEPLARRIHVVDTHGSCLALSASGDLAHEVQIDDAVALCVPKGGDVGGVMTTVPEWRGRTLQLVDGELVGDDFRAMLVADHRAPL